MKIKALIAALVLSSSSVALATPALAAPALAELRAPRRDLPSIAIQISAKLTRMISSVPFEHRTLPPLDVSWIRHVIEEPAPMVLANDSHLSSPMLIRVATPRAFSKIELRANDGSTTIDRVVLDYGDGRTRSVTLAGTVDGKRTLTVDVTEDASSIVKIVVVGKSKRGASIDVLAS